MNGTNYSEFYLERVGHEANARLSKQLKEGRNLVGRCIKEEHIEINSVHCSQRHCVITVVGQSVDIQNLSTSNGTTINGQKMGGETVKLKELDVIGVVGGVNPLQDMIGNYCFFVYRLRKRNSDNIVSIEIDTETVEISDDETEQRENNEMICLDLVDSDEELDLNIQLSELFNIEIKQELAELDELEVHCKQLKKEPSDFFDVEYMDDDQNDVNNIGPDQVSNDQGNNNSTPIQSDADDSTETVRFSSTAHSDNDHTIEPIELVVHESTDAEMLSPADLPNESTEAEMVSSTDHPNETTEAEIMPPADQPNESLESVSNSISNDQGESSDRPTVHKIAADKLQRTIAKVNEQAKRKQAPEIIEPKPLEKRRKTRNFEQIGRPEPERSPAKTKIFKNKLKSTPEKEPLVEKTTTKPKEPAAEKPKKRTTAHVKITMDNRGSFLTDPTQIPVLPKDIKATSTKKETPVSKPLMTHRNSDAEPMDALCSSPPIEIPIDMKPHTKMKSFSKSSVARTSTDDKPLKYRNDSPPPIDIAIPSCSTMKKLSFSDLLKYQPNIQSSSDIHQHNFTTKKDEMARGDGFQFDPCHKVISQLTSFDCRQYKTVVLFCKSVDTNISPFVDTYTDHVEYRRILVDLMMVELWKEIEIEFINSQILDFETVTINYQNLEKRGDGQRMIFHCQAETLYKSKSILDGHLVLVRLEKIEFLALITNISYTSKSAENKLAHFTMETSAVTETLPTQSLQIRPVTVITNTLNAFSAICNLKNSPLLDLVLNPLSSPSESSTANVNYKGYDTLDTDQQSILMKIYRRCINLTVPNISVLDGAAGTGKTRMIVNLALQLVYGDSLPKPLRILICSKSNRNIDEIAMKLMHIRDKTYVNTKIQLVRYGVLEHMHPSIRRISVQSLKETDESFFKFANLDNLKKQEEALRLKVLSLSLDKDNDHKDAIKLWKSKLFKITTLQGRLEKLEKKKLNDATTVILNASDIICTTLGSIWKLQNYIPNVDVCIIDEATQCNEPLTLLPFRFGMPSLVLVGDSKLFPPTPYSPVVNQKNYGNSLFARFKKLFSDKSESPVFEIVTQHRMHPEILYWPNDHFYKNCLRASVLKMNEHFPIMPYRVISYSRIVMESDNIMLIIKVLLKFIDYNAHSIGVICSNFKQNSIMANKLREHPYITTNTVESYVTEKDVIIIWISREHGMCHLANQKLLNLAVTRAKKSLLICGTDLLAYKSRPLWKSVLENAQQRKSFFHFKNLLEHKLENTIRNGLK